MSRHRPSRRTRQVRRRPASTTRVPNLPLVVIEGIDGAGKTTQARMLEEMLIEEGHGITSTFEPSHLSVGKWLRAQLHSGAVGLDELTRCYLFAADRAQHLDQVIMPAIERGEVVICDRYILTTLAYQRSDPDTKISIQRLLTIHDFPPPKLTLWLCLDPELAMGRLDSRQSKSVYEKADRLMRIAANYAELATHPLLAAHHIVRIDASGTKDETFAQIRQAVHASLQAPP